MIDLLKKWLKDQLTPLVNVKRCTFAQTTGMGITEPVRRPDVIVQLWTGINAHIHLLDQPMNTRTIRRIVEDATNMGIATLFLVDVKLLPRSGERVLFDKWFMAIYALTNRLYAYKLEAGAPMIGELHFTPVGRTVEVETHYGAKIAIHELRCFRQSVKPHIIKGFWMVADFGTDTAQKPAPAAGSGYTDNDHSRRQQYHPPPPSSNGSHPHPASNGTSGYGASSSRTSTRPTAPKTKLETAYETLGIQINASRDDVKAAFRKLAFEVHPDVSELPKAEAEVRFKLLSEAYEYIKTNRGWG